MIKKFLENCKNPQGKFGKLVLRAMNKGHAHLSEWALSVIEINNGQKILDVGCGGGGNIERMLKKFSSSVVDGVDYSATSVAQSGEKLRRFGNRCRIVQGDACQLPVDDCIYDVVVTFESVYFWKDPQKGFFEIYRVLKTGGKVLAAVEMCNPAKGKFWTDRCEGMTVYTSEELKRFVEFAGFSEVEVFLKGKTICAITGKKQFK